MFCGGGAGLVKAGVTAVLFYLLFRKLNFREFAATLHNARWDVLVLGVALLWIAHFICSVRWRLLMQPVAVLVWVWAADAEE